MTAFTVSTNGHRRELLSLHELPDVARMEFDYAPADDGCSPRFFHYRGAWYDVHEFDRCDPAGPINLLSANALEWHGVQTDTMFSATVVRFLDGDDDGFVVAGRMYS